jgi:outer membrane lipoprotein-sorting protein
MIRRRKREFALISVSLALLVSACRSQTDSVTTESNASETVVSSTPPFQTREPDRYRATRTITTVNVVGETLVTKTSVARDGTVRRHESRVNSKTIVYLDVPEGRLVLLPEEKVYADLTEESTVAADKNDDTLKASPEGLLHAELSSTSYQELGAETIAGRKTNKYRIVVNSPSAANVSLSETLIWVDEALQMPIRSETKSPNGTRVTMELSDIALDVDERFFQIPNDYKKVAFSEVRKQLKKAGASPPS